MDILLDPNIAYLLLVGGLMLVILAMAAPGTGLLEIAALFTLLLAGRSAAQLPLNPWALGLLILGAILFILSVRRSGWLVYLAISILALVVGSAFLFRGTGGQPAVNPILALVVSVLTAGFFWIAARKAVEARSARPLHDLSALIGEVGEAKTDLRPEGTVQVAGELWTARSDDPIVADSYVQVTGRDGFILEVKPANK